jgi:hypothetical protein
MSALEEGSNSALLSVQETNRSLSIRRWDPSMGCITLVFLFPWTYALATIGADLKHTGVVGAALLLLIWVALAGFTLWHFLGRESIALTELEIIHERRLVVPIFRRTGLLSRIERVEVLSPLPREDEQSDHYGLRIRSPELQISLRANLPRDEAAILCDRVHKWIESHTKSTLETFDSSAPLIKPEDWAPPGKVQKLFETVGSTLTSVIIAVVGIIWNVTVISMLVQGVRNGRWGLVCFVIPVFVLIGLFLGLCSLVIFFEGARSVTRGIRRLFVGR